MSFSDEPRELFDFVEHFRGYIFVTVKKSKHDILIRNSPVGCWLGDRCRIATKNIVGRYSEIVGNLLKTASVDIIGLISQYDKVFCATPRYLASVACVTLRSLRNSLILFFILITPININNTDIISKYQVNIKKIEENY